SSPLSPALQRLEPAPTTSTPRLRRSPIPCSATCPYVSCCPPSDRRSTPPAWRTASRSIRTRGARSSRGGHFGVITLLILSLHERRGRHLLFGGAMVSAIGTMLARTHYAADTLGGGLLGYAVGVWGERHLPGQRSSSASVS